MFVLEFLAVYLTDLYVVKIMDTSLIMLIVDAFRSIGFPELKLLRPFGVSLSRFHAGKTIDSTGIESEHKSQRGAINYNVPVTTTIRCTFSRDIESVVEGARGYLLISVVNAAE